MQTVRHMGEVLPLGKLIRHYRLMARLARFPRSKALYRTLTRTAIAQARKQRAEAAEQREAA